MFYLLIFHHLIKALGECGHPSLWVLGVEIKFSKECSIIRHNRLTVCGNAAWRLVRKSATPCNI